MLLSNPEKFIDIKSNKSKEILTLYNELNDANIRKLSHMDTGSMDFDEKKKMLLKLEYDSKKQRDLFLDIINDSIEYITDVLVKGLQDDINKDTLWRLFGDVIYSNLEKNLQGTKICNRCNKRFNYKNNMDRNIYCDDCKEKND